jgi:hypothetical protein
MDLIKTDDPDLKRDPVTGALINVNNSKYMKYQSERNNRKLLNELQEDVLETKKELLEIKKLLLQSLKEK